MSRHLTRHLVVFGAIVAAAQLIRPALANPATDASRTIQAHVGAANGLPAILQRACGNCHSNATVWPAYSRVAPLSWLVARTVSEGRKAVNFSEWAAYPRDTQRLLLAASCEDVRQGTMPVRGYTLLYPEAALSAADIETICAAAR
jgi:hypothetical protein